VSTNSTGIRINKEIENCMLYIVLYAFVAGLFIAIVSAVAPPIAVVIAFIMTTLSFLYATLQRIFRNIDNLVQRRISKSEEGS
jgi:uncharacterized membrane protein